MMIRADGILVGFAPALQAKQCKMYRIIQSLSSLYWDNFMLGTVNAMMNLK